jgi:hypothetical protein
MVYGTNPHFFLIHSTSNVTKMQYASNWTILQVVLYLILLHPTRC